MSANFFRISRCTVMISRTPVDHVVIKVWCAWRNSPLGDGAWVKVTEREREREGGGGREQERDGTGEREEGARTSYRERRCSSEIGKVLRGCCRVPRSLDHLFPTDHHFRSRARLSLARANLGLSRNHTLQCPQTNPFPFLPTSIPRSTVCNRQLRFL